MEKKPIIHEKDLLELVSRVVVSKKFVIRFTLASFLVGMLLAFTSVKQYTVNVEVAPEEGGGMSFASSGLGSLASIAGIDLSTMNGSSDAIYPLLYPDIVESLPFLASLMDVRVTTSDGLVDTTYAVYQSKIKKEYWLSKVFLAPKRGVKKIIGAVSGKGKIPVSYVFDPYHLSEKQLGMIDKLKGCIGVFVDKKTNVITISFTDSEPEIAATMAEAVVSSLMNTVVDYRTKKAQKDSEYMKTLYLESKAEYEESQMVYADFVDHNRNVTQERFLIERNRLEAEMELKNALYTQWTQQYQLSLAKLQEQTPVFTTIKPSAIPALPSSIRRLYQLILYTILGFCISVVWVLSKGSIVNLWNRLKGTKA